jgi:hypothetical protein
MPYSKHVPKGGPLFHLVPIRGHFIPTLLPSQLNHYPPHSVIVSLLDVLHIFEVQCSPEYVDWSHLFLAKEWKIGLCPNTLLHTVLLPPPTPHLIPDTYPAQA